MSYDFSGYATKNNLECADGRIIRQNAFKGNDGTTVPLVWAHMHDSPSNVLGHAVLENRSDGVYAYCSFNETEKGKTAKEIVKHGDVASLSIYANQLKQMGADVIHGVIREVSLVLAGANPGAKIENISFAHMDGSEFESEDEVIITSGIKPDNLGYDIEHADSENQNGSESKNDESDDESIEDVINSMTEKQKNVLYYLVGSVGEDTEDEEMSQSIDEEGHDVMKHNVFDVSEVEENTLSHDEMKAILDEAKEVGSMKKAFLAHGIDQIDILYPEAKSVTPTPELITRRMEWVSDVWNSLKKTPFTRIKSVAADLTEDDARAKGYIKGNKKEEEQFGLLKRVTTPQTVYKKQSLDRDDIIDITDFDVVAWLKAEMRMMLDEELSRAVLVGDGRLISSPDKIKEDNIRPIYQDDDMYTIHWDVTAPAEMTDPTDKSNYLVDQALRARKDYKGSGNPTFYASIDVINDMLLARDKMGRRLYNTEAELASALRVNRIVEVPVFEGVTRTDDETQKHELVGLIVNLSDYSLGTDRGGEVNFFDDFDIDYNKEKYLIETRVSGALTHPYSAIALETKSAMG